MKREEKVLLEVEGVLLKVNLVSGTLKVRGLLAHEWTRTHLRSVLQTADGLALASQVTVILNCYLLLISYLHFRYCISELHFWRILCIFP